MLLKIELSLQLSGRISHVTKQNLKTFPIKQRMNLRKHVQFTALKIKYNNSNNVWLLVRLHSQQDMYLTILKKGTVRCIRFIIAI